MVTYLAKAGDWREALAAGPASGPSSPVIGFSSPGHSPCRPPPRHFRRSPALLPMAPPALAAEDLPGPAQPPPPAPARAVGQGEAEAGGGGGGGQVTGSARNLVALMRDMAWHPLDAPAPDPAAVAGGGGGGGCWTESRGRGSPHGVDCAGLPPSRGLETLNPPSHALPSLLSADHDDRFMSPRPDPPAASAAAAATAAAAAAAEAERLRRRVAELEAELLRAAAARVVHPSRCDSDCREAPANGRRDGVADSDSDAPAPADWGLHSHRDAAAGNRASARAGGACWAGGFESEGGRRRRGGWGPPGTRAPWADADSDQGSGRRPSDEASAGAGAVGARAWLAGLLGALRGGGGGEAEGLLGLLGLGRFAGILRREEVRTVRELARLSESELAEMGVVTYAARAQMVAAARGLRALLDAVERPG